MVAQVVINFIQAAGNDGVLAGVLLAFFAEFHAHLGAVGHAVHGCLLDHFQALGIEGDLRALFPIRGKAVYQMGERENQQTDGEGPWSAHQEPVRKFVRHGFEGQHTGGGFAALRRCLFPIG